MSITQHTCVSDAQSIPAVTAIITLLKLVVVMRCRLGVAAGRSLQGARSAWPYRQSTTPAPVSPAALLLALKERASQAVTHRHRTRTGTLPRSPGPPPWWTSEHL